MKLSTINELKQRGKQRLYKGMSPTDYEKFKIHQIPGFMGELAIALIYAEPSLTGEPTDDRYLISAIINLDEVTDKSDQIEDMCTWDKQGSPLRDEIWTAPSSGSGTHDIIHYGKPLTDWKLETIIHGDEEWQQLYNQHIKSESHTSVASHY